MTKRTVNYSRQFKKDAKRYRNKEDVLIELMIIVGKLEQDEAIPKEYSPHPLKGDCKGRMECHVKSNVLLIWRDERSGDIWVERLGTHHELFGL